MVSSTLTAFFNNFFRSVENYTTKIPRFKNSSTEKKVTNTSNTTNNGYGFSQLRDTKAETILAKLKENNFEVIRNSFFLAEDECSLGKFDLQFSGSTCVMVFCILNKIICANAGDSRALLASDSRKVKSFVSKFYFKIGNP
jgi:UDP-N-acetylmuramate-alanine ligase